MSSFVFLSANLGSYGVWGGHRSAWMPKRVCPAMNSSDSPTFESSSKKKIKAKPRPKPVISFPGRDGKIVKGYTLRVMQWNVDFSTDNVFSRTKHLIQIIGEEK